MLTAPNTAVVNPLHCFNNTCIQPEVCVAACIHPYTLLKGICKGMPSLQWLSAVYTSHPAHSAEPVIHSVLTSTELQVLESGYVSMHVSASSESGWCDYSETHGLLQADWLTVVSLQGLSTRVIQVSRTHTQAWLCSDKGSPSQKVSCSICRPQLR